MPKTATQHTVAGVWTHPVDDDYPEGETMRVTETRSGPSPCTSWDTKVVRSDGEVTEYQFVHVDGTHVIMFAHRINGGQWTPVTTMALSRWEVTDGRTDTARAMMVDFFTVGGHERQGD